MGKGPLFPHIPSRTTRTELSRDDLRFLPDSPEFLTQTINSIGYRAELDSVFQQAIARAKGAG